MSLLISLARIVVPEVVSAPSPQTLQEWTGGGMIQCQVSFGSQLIEWWKENTLLALLNLTNDNSGVLGDTSVQHGKHMHA